MGHALIIIQRCRRKVLIHWRLFYHG
jgi:hypothetical protein